MHDVVKMRTRETQSNLISGQIDSKKGKKDSHCIAECENQEHRSKNYVHFTVCSSRTCWSAGFSLCERILYRTGAVNEPVKFANSSSLF